jgi:superfamily I DNA/RNA helicase
MADTDKYELARKARQEKIDQILGSDSRWKVVVAGPGTGKTYLFKKIIEGKPNTLTLSFVNSLVEDLSLELCGLSDVRTLHGYARHSLAHATKHSIKVYPGMAHVMRQDAKILLGIEPDFERMFCVRDDSNEHLGFYKERRRYYDHYGYTDVMYAAALYFEQNPERVPTYDQVVVDEFQDFNPLEVSLIDLLADKSPILLAGDDDQALYDFKHASSKHIRERHDGDGSKYAAFNLPYCSRCNRVIVDAANDVIDEAKKRNLLQGRIDKPYLYFDDEVKDAECAAHGQVDYIQTYASAIPWAIERAIQDMALQVRGTFSVLVIAATGGQCRSITKALRKKGLANVSHYERDRSEPTLLDGLTLILENKDCNLGWRIVAMCRLPTDEFEAVLKATNNKKPFKDGLPAATRQEIKALASELRHVRDDKATKEELADLLSQLGIDPLGPARERLKETFDTGSNTSAAIRRIPIKVTTVQSSKGLAADLVCIAYLDDQYVIKAKDKENVSDQDVCNLIVALTRARKKLLLISSAKKNPTFLDWIDPSRLNRLPSPA